MAGGRRVGPQGAVALCHTSRSDGGCRTLTPMIVDQLERSLEDGFCRLSARIRKNPARHGHDVRLWYRFPEGLAPGGEVDPSPFVPPAVYWCLRRGEDLTVDGPVSPRLLGTMDGIMRVYRSLFPQAVSRPIEVQA